MHIVLGCSDTYLPILMERLYGHFVFYEFLAILCNFLKWQVSASQSILAHRSTYMLRMTLTLALKDLEMRKYCQKQPFMFQFAIIWVTLSLPFQLNQALPWHWKLQKWVDIVKFFLIFNFLQNFTGTEKIGYVASENILSTYLQVFHCL